MAGHSKWANIQHRKNRQDAKRGSLWTKIIREVTVAARDGGPDPSMNARLRLALDKARLGNVPKDKLQNAIARGAGKLEGASYEEIRYEGYGIGGAAVMIDCMTDNRTRTVAEVRHALAKNGGNLGTDGSVAFNFKHCGQFVFAPFVQAMISAFGWISAMVALAVSALATLPLARALRRQPAPPPSSAAKGHAAGEMGLRAQLKVAARDPSWPYRRRSSSAWASVSWPLALMRAVRPERSKSAKPSSASSRCIWALTAACVRPIFSPARAKVPSRATAMKVLSSRSIHKIP